MKKDVQTYEAAMQELEELLEKLSSDTVSLEESLTLYARAAQLIALCDKTLRQADLRLQTITEALHAVSAGEECDDV